MVNFKPLYKACRLALTTLLLSSLAVIFIPFQSNAQSESETGLPFITNYHAKIYEALPQTWCVQEGDQGIMYFGIQSYILEYDGVKWRKIPFEIKSASAVCRSMSKNKDAIIYYGGYGDLGYLTKDSLGQIISKSLLELIPAANRNFLDIWSTHTTDNSIYFQSREYIFRIGENTSSGKRDVKVWKPETKFMYAFYLDGNYFVQQQGLGLYKMVNDSLVLIPGSEFLGKERVQIMLPYQTATTEKKYLFGLFYSGLYIYDGKTFEPFVTQADPIIKSGSLLYKGAQLSNGSYVLCTTGNGLVIIDAEGKLLQRINRGVGLQDETIYAAYQDKKGTLWLALDNGISRMETGSPLTQYNVQSGIKTGVLSIQRFGGHIYIGTTNGLLQYDDSKKYFNPVPGVLENQIFSLLPDKNELLIPGDGLFVIKDNKSIIQRPSVSGDLTLNSLYISTKNPDLLLGGGSFGMAVFTRQKETGAADKSVSWHFAGYISQITESIWSLSETKEGKIWAGTANGVVYLVDVILDENGNLDNTSTVVEEFGGAQGLQNGVGSVYKIKGTNYFVADSSLYTFDESQKRFMADTTFGKFSKGGAATEFVMVQDYKGRVWIRAGKETILATPNQTGGYDLNTTQFNSMAELTVQSIYPEKNGIFWIGTTDGLLRYDENLEKNTEQSFTTVIRHIAAGKQVLNPNANQEQTSVSVSYKNNTLRFEYAAPFFDHEDKTTYQTWLEGFEDNWSDFDNNYYKEYTNLSTGDYHFHVRAKNIHQQISEEAIYTFSIHPPWYLTWWSYLFYALAAMATIYAIIRWRTHQLHEKHRALEKTVEERTSQLSHRVKELAVINSVQDGLVREMNMGGIYELVGEKIRQIFNAQVIDIVTYDKKANLLEDIYVYEKGDRTLAGSWEPAGFRKHVIDTGQFLVINEAMNKKIIEFNSKVISGEMPKSAVWVPLIAGDEVKGMISLQNLDIENAFSDADVSLINTLANSMSVALESVRRFDETNRLLKETEQRTAELAVINSVQDGLAKELNMQGIYKLIGDRLCGLFPDTQTIVIRTFDHVNGLEHFYYAIENGDYLEIDPQPFIWESKQLILTKKPLDIEENYIALSEAHGESSVTEGLPVKSAVFVPMIVGEVVKGSISLQNVDREHAFGESDLRLLTTLTNSMSAALENARLFDETNRLLKETEQRTAELSIINSLQDGLAREPDIKGIYELVGEKMREIFNAQVIDIVAYSKTTNLIEDCYAYEKGDRTLTGSRPLQGFRKHVIDTRQPIIINKDVDLLRSTYHSTITTGKGAKSLVMVPLITGEEATGVISLQNLDQENAFSDSDVSLLTTMANSMSVALESARLFDETNRLLKETEQRTAELAVINNVQEGLASELDIKGIYNLVGDRIGELFDTQSVLIRSFDHQTGLEHWQYAVEKGEHLFIEPRPFIWANKLLIKTKQHLLINKDYVETAKKYGGAGVSKGLPPKSAMFVPMIAGDQVKGSVSLQNIDKENAYSESDLRLLTTLTNSMSVALENARLFDETTYLLGEAKQRATELSTVNSISKALASQLDADDLIKLVGDELKNLFKANIVYLALLHQKTNTINFPYQHGDVIPPMKLGHGLTSQIILTGEPLLINKDLDEFTTQMGLERIGLPSASYLGVPIPVGDEIIGVLSIQSTEHENRFNENDLRLLSTIASSVGVALGNATLFEEVKLAKMEAETASKLAERANEAKSAFLSTVSHELRTPLTSVLGFAKIIKKRLVEKIFPIVNKEDPKTEKTINQISENLQVVISEGERLTHLINDVLDLAKIEAGKMEWSRENVYIPEIVERAIAATSSLFDQKPLKLVKHIDAGLPEITGDKDKLIQVVINLISNSVKFTNKGTITCSAYLERDEIIVSITDTGIGIAPGDFDAVFEQFKQVGGDTLTDKPKGTGLGLPICKEIVEHLGGRIWLTSQIGKGSTFSFAFSTSKTTESRPIHLNDLVKQLKEQVAYSQLNVKGLSANILIVDDDDSIRSLLHQELGDAGYQIQEARNGKEALECVRTTRPDLIILDVMMPEMNGFDVAAVLKNDPQTMDIPIIVLSIVQDKARGFRIGVDRYLTKPIDTHLLFAEIGTLLEQGKSKKKVMIVDENSETVNTLSEVLKAKGYVVTESAEKELVEKAVAQQPDIIIINSALSSKQDIVKTLRFEKGLENVLFLVYQ